MNEMPVWAQNHSAFVDGVQQGAQPVVLFADSTQFRAENPFRHDPRSVGDASSCCRSITSTTYCRTNSRSSLSSAEWMVDACSGACRSTPPERRAVRTSSNNAFNRCVRPNEGKPGPSIVFARCSISSIASSLMLFKKSASIHMSPALMANRNSVLTEDWPPGSEFLRWTARRNGTEHKPCSRVHSFQRARVARRDCPFCDDAGEFASV